MHNLPAAPTSLVLIAGEHYWPNLQALMYWAPSLRNVFIYSTEDTGDAGRRLRVFCEEYLRAQRPEMSVHSSDSSGSDFPQSVRAQVELWRSQFAGESWLLVATDNACLSLFGLSSSSAQGDIHLVCRNDKRGCQSRWVHLARDDASGVRAEPIEVSAGVADAVPVSVLLRHFWGDDVHVEGVFSADTLELSRKALHHRGDWGRVAAEAGASLELPFEAFVARALDDLGIANLAVVGRKASEGGSSERETFIVANHGGLRIIDCNLNRLEGLASHLRRLADGLEARILFLWPTRAFPDEFRGLLTAYHMDLLERQDLGRFFHRLAEFAGISTLLPALMEADNIMEEVAAKGLRFFPARRPRPPAKLPKPTRLRPPRPPRVPAAARSAPHAPGAPALQFGPAQSAPMAQP